MLRGSYLDIHEPSVKPFEDSFVKSCKIKVERIILDLRDYIGERDLESDLKFLESVIVEGDRFECLAVQSYEEQFLKPYLLRLLPVLDPAKHKLIFNSKTSKPGMREKSVIYFPAVSSKVKCISQK